MATADPSLQHLSETAAALEARRDVDALASLLLAWRHWRSPALVPVLEALSGVLARARGPIGGKTPPERAVRWRALFHVRDPADLGRLLASATEPSSLDECAAR